MRKLLALLAALALSPAAATAAAFQVRDVLPIRGQLPPGDFVWDDEGVPPGPTRIVVDLGSHHLHVYRSGYEIGRSSIVFGDEEKPTPLGTFPIRGKSENHWSRRYDAPMPFSLWLTRSGVAIHGTDVEAEMPTHGCVGVPEGFAARLFRAVRVGEPVLITTRWRPRAERYAAR